MLDTNVVVTHLRTPGRHDDELGIHLPHLPATVVGELYGGAAKSARPERNKAGIERFLDSCILLSNEAETGAIYGDIWAALAAAGTMIPTNDIWIAASAIQHGLPLVTNDAHFANVSGLAVEGW